VRDAASETLGVLVKLLGEPTMTKLMPDLDPIKMAKIKEFAEKAEITGKRPKLQPEGGAAPPKAGGAKVVKPGQKRPAAGAKPGAAGKPKPVARPPPPTQSSDEEDNYEAEFAQPPPKTAARPAATARVGSAPARKTSAPAAAAARPRPGIKIIKSNVGVYSVKLKSKMFEDRCNIVIILYLVVV
jgi:hypothetical protein